VLTNSGFVSQTTAVARFDCFTGFERAFAALHFSLFMVFISIIVKARQEVTGDKKTVGEGPKGARNL
jgi:hypothetical protein